MSDTTIIEDIIAGQIPEAEAIYVEVVNAHVLPLVTRDTNYYPDGKVVAHGSSDGLTINIAVDFEYDRPAQDFAEELRRSMFDNALCAKIEQFETARARHL